MGIRNTQMAMEILNALMEIPWVRQRSSIFSHAKILIVFLTSFKNVVAVCAISRFFNVLAIYVEKEYRRRGVGRRILDKAIEEARKQDLNFISLSVYAKNLPALQLYSKLGFRKILNLEQLPYYVMILPLTHRGEIICNFLSTTLSKTPPAFLFFAAKFIEKVLVGRLL